MRPSNFSIKDALLRSSPNPPWRADCCNRLPRLAKRACHAVASVEAGLPRRSLGEGGSILQLIAQDDVRPTSRDLVVDVETVRQ